MGKARGCTGECRAGLAAAGWQVDGALGLVLSARGLPLLPPRLASALQKSRIQIGVMIFFDVRSA